MLRQELEDGFLGLLPREERERIRHQWTRGIGSVALSLIPFETADQPTRVDVRGPDPLLDLVGQIAQRFGPRISGLPDRLNPRVKPDVAADAPIDDFDDWEAAVSMLTAVQGQPFVPELPSGMPPLWTVMQRQSRIQAAHQACSILGGFAPRKPCRGQPRRSPRASVLAVVSRRGPSRWRRLLAVSCVLFAVVGCATAPETGRRQVLLIDSAQEAQLGLQAFQQIKQDTPVSRDRQANAQLQSVGRRVASVVNIPHADWEFVLFESDEPNAFALPGGKIGINTGILPITQTEAGLATVIAHEIAHVTARHGAERMSQDLLVQVGGTALSAALGSRSPVTRDLAMQAYGIGTEVGVMLPYSRTQEYEADRVGLLYMARAGFDPTEAVGFWERFQAENRDSGTRTPEFLSTHPLDDARIAQIRRFLPQAIAEYEAARR